MEFNYINYLLQCDRGREIIWAAEEINTQRCNLMWQLNVQAHDLGALKGYYKTRSRQCAPLCVHLCGTLES